MEHALSELGRDQEVDILDILHISPELLAIGPVG
jgi:hypothetical protein